MAVAKDGALLVGDDVNGVIYRLASRDGKGAMKPVSAPARAMQAQAAKGIGVPIAMQRRETAAKGELTIESPSFPANGPIPAKHSEYKDGLSPALSWTAVPGAKSYAIVMEDPDAKPITPFVHWVAWNIPADVMSLPERQPLVEHGPALPAVVERPLLTYPVVGIGEHSERRPDQPVLVGRPALVVPQGADELIEDR